MDGTFLKRAREAKKLSQEALAHEMGISASQLSRYESNDKIPRIDELERAASFLGVPLLSLIGHVETARETTHAEAPASNGPNRNQKTAELLDIVVTTFLESWGVAPDRTRGFVSEVLRAYRKPQTLSEEIPPEHLLKLLIRSVALELADQRDASKAQKK